MESKAARITRYVVLAVFLCLLWGSALFMGLVTAAALWHGGPNPMVGGAFPPVGLACGYAGWQAWKGFHRCDASSLGSVAIFLALATGLVAYRAALVAGITVTSPSVLMLDDIWRAAPALASVWALAGLGATLAMREQRRRLTQPVSTAR